MLTSTPDPAPLATPLVLNAAGACTALAPTLVQSAFLARRGSLAVRESALLDPEGNPVSACGLPLLDPFLVGPARLFALTDFALGDLPSDFRGQIASLRLKFYPLLGREFEGRLPNGHRRGDLVGFELKSRGEAKFHGSLPTEVNTRDVTALAEVLPLISDELRRGVADVAIVVAAHSDLTPERLAQLYETQRLYSDDNDDGILPGEAAVVLAFSTPQTTRRANLKQLAQVVAVTRGHDPARPDNDASAFEAIGLTLAMRRVVQAAQLAPHQIGWLYSDLSFEQYRVHEYQAILARCQEILGPPQVHEFPSQRLGFLGCATVPLHLALAANAWEYGYAPADRCLSISGHDDGTRCSVLLTR